MMVTVGRIATVGGVMKVLEDGGSGEGDDWVQRSRSPTRTQGKPKGVVYIRLDRN